ncbi:hypothetical protein BKK52_10395 [Rodentibacter trehalosifermentans]|uniref:Uncharacterized protein n=1 Tax=Rodentibacter trehalosifermentans TaxID=1908263 RepID=A0A1V3IXE4_9PAST|nr:hypothetical protein [Rodentibacter trehalosifermentans]OOF46911.1 hypothetical protein BKK52_10395 [Rodentibacter trehalosifermentans]
MSRIDELEKKFAKLETEIEGLKDECMYLRAILADLLQSAVEQSAISPDFIVQKLQDYQYSPLSWISKADNPQMCQRHLAILKEFADAIYLGIAPRKKPLKDAETANKIKAVQANIDKALGQPR